MIWRRKLLRKLEDYKLLLERKRDNKLVLRKHSDYNKWLIKVVMKMLEN